MNFIPIQRIVQGKIYFDRLPLVNRDESTSNTVILFAANAKSTEGMIEGIKFFPTKPYFLHSKREVNPITGAVKSDVQGETEFFKTLKNDRLISRITRVEVFDAKKVDKATVIDLGGANDDLVAVLVARKLYDANGSISNVAAFLKYTTEYFVKVLAVEGVTGGFTAVISVDTPSPLLSAIEYALSKKPNLDDAMLKNLKKILSSGTFIFTSTANRKLLLELDLVNRWKERSKLLVLLKKFQKLSAYSEEEFKKAATGDVDLATDADAVLSSADVEAVKAIENDTTESKFVSPSEDAKGMQVPTSGEVQGDDTPPEVVKSVADAQTAQTATPDDISQITPVTDVDFDQILGAGIKTVDTHEEKRRKEFLDRYLPVQATALAALKKQAETSQNKTLEPMVVKDDTIINPDMKNISYTAVTKNYYDKQHLADQISIFESLNNDRENPVIIQSYEVKDSSDALNMKDEVTVKMLDDKGKRHTFSVDVPKLSHDGFLLINGNKKSITKQMTYLPVVKETDSRVQIITNYRKTFLFRKGEKTNATLDKILRLFYQNSFSKCKRTLGNNSQKNVTLNTSIPYNFVGSKISTLLFFAGKGSLPSRTINFSQEKLRSILEEDNEVQLNYEEFIPVGIEWNGEDIAYIFAEDLKNSRRIVRISPKKPTVVSDVAAPDLTSFLHGLVMNSGDESLVTKYGEMTKSKSLAYTEIKIASVAITLGILVAFYKGLQGALDLYKIKYTVENAKRRTTENETLFEFSDKVYVYVNSESDAAKELFINGLAQLDCKEFTFADSERIGALYFDYFKQATGSRNTGKALLNFESSMIDPITLEVLKTYGLPETFPELLIYANNMLGDFNKTRKNDTGNFRVRDSEMINVALYNTLMKAFNQYKRTAKTGIVSPISVPKDAVIKELGNNQDIEDYSILNPFYEAEMKSKITFKGPSGLLLGSL